MDFQHLEKEKIFEAIEDFVLHIISWLLDIDVDIFKNDPSKKYASSLFDKKLIRLCRTLSVVELIHNLAIQDKCCTQREIYYRLYNVFHKQSQTNSYIKDVCQILGFQRSTLNIYASEKGCIAGLLVLKKNNEVLKLREKENGIMINECLLQVDHIDSLAHYIIVVEKYSLYQKLCEHKLWDILPCILITGKGFPDVATRKILCELQKRFNLECAYIGDYDPYGILIYLAYKEGNVKDVGINYDCKNIKWVGMCSEDVQLFPPESILRLTQKDKNVIKKLLNDKKNIENSQIKKEICQMEKNNCKFEIEAVVCLGMEFFIKKYLVLKILRKQWLI